MSVTTGAILRVTTHFANPGPNVVENVYFFRCTFASTQTDAGVRNLIDGWLGEIYQVFDASLRPSFIPTGLTIDVVQWSSGRWEQTYQVYSGPWASAPTCTSTTSALPHGVAAVINFSTGLGKHQGRKYIGGLTEGTSTTEGALEVSLQTQLLVAFIKLLAPRVISAGNSISFVITSPTLGTVYSVLGVLVRSVWGYQRRRKAGVGI